MGKDKNLPGDEAHDGAILIFGVINVLSESRRFGKALTTRKKLLSGVEGPPNHHPPSTVDPLINNKDIKFVYPKSPNYFKEFLVLHLFMN